MDFSQITEILFLQNLQQVFTNFDAKNYIYININKKSMLLYHFDDDYHILMKM